ncbi:cyclodeaminase/cyclohydrolase family protein [Microbacterium sp. LWH11-1.2]|uniref:cyclodeaminase/cyclohydrolase family protein n=1 Tax=Microbacterium sp. LWH11-1.2 TaxID=3135258 RepID=UPI003139258D
MDHDADVPTSTPLDGWLAQLGQPNGAPGGGAAAGVMLGIAASLLRMVAEYTPDDPRATECADRLARMRVEALDAAEADGILSAGFGAALALPAEDSERDARVRDAAIEAAESSTRLGAIGIRLLPEVRVLTEIGNPHLQADLAVAAEALRAGLAGATINLRANLQIARKHDAPAPLRSDLDAEASRLTEAQNAVARIADELAARAGE